MRLDTSLVQRMDQRQILAPRMIQSMEILQLPVMALEERIRQELDENPALELREPTADDLDKVERPDPREADDGAIDFNRLEALERDMGEPFGDDHRPSRAGLDEAADRKHDAMSNAPDRPQSLQDYLDEQAGFLDAPADTAELLRYLISHIDERGYLVCGPAHADPIAELVRNAPVPVQRTDLEYALHLLQKFDPPGVGARNLEECLLLQLNSETPHRGLVEQIIQHHLEDVRHNRLPVIQKRTGRDIGEIQEAIEVLRHLNPKPGAVYSSDNIPYVTPDLIVERTEDGEYEVRLVDDWIPDVHIPRSVIELAKNKGHDPQTREYVKRKIQAAQWLLDSIAQRKNTLEKVTRAIIRHQRNFLDKGPEHIEPLKMQQIADDVGVHVTTVSRAVDEKWVQTPRGIFPLKRFFGGGTQTASGEEVAWETIKNKLLEIIDQEDKANPLSDEDLVIKLQEAGYPIARRTITKYRKALNIASSRERKDWSLASAKS